MCNEPIGYFIIQNDEQYIADDPDLAKAKNIWHFYRNQEINCFVIEHTNQGIAGAWSVVSCSPLRDRLTDALIAARPAPGRKCEWR